MNNRYLYHAKRTDNGEWVEGFIVKKHGLFFIYDIINSDTCRQSNYEVDQSTICQCTGKTDIEKNLIFEHDIIKTPVGNARIEWNCSPIPTDNHIDVGFKVFFFDEKANDNYRHDLGYWIGKSEVIGNIFDGGSENIGK